MSGRESLQGDDTMRIVDDMPAIDGLERIAADPVAANALKALQARSADMLTELIDRTVSILASIDKPTASAAPPVPATMAAHANAASQRKAVARQRRELAEALIIGVLLNRNNPDWNPADPASSRPTDEGALLALLRLELPG